MSATQSLRAKSRYDTPHRPSCVEPLRARRACAGGLLQPSGAAVRCRLRVAAVICGAPVATLVTQLGACGVVVCAVEVRRRAHELHLAASVHAAVTRRCHRRQHCMHRAEATARRGGAHDARVRPVSRGDRDQVATRHLPRKTREDVTAARGQRVAWQVGGWRVVGCGAVCRACPLSGVARTICGSL